MLNFELGSLEEAAEIFGDCSQAFNWLKEMSSCGLGGIF